MFCFLCFRMTVLFLIMWKEITSSIFRCGLSTKSSQMTRQDGYIPIGHVIFDAAIRDMHAPTERTDHRDPLGMNSFNLILQLSILMWILTTLPMCYSNISSLIFPLDPGCKPRISGLVPRHSVLQSQPIPGDFGRNISICIDLLYPGLNVLQRRFCGAVGRSLSVATFQSSGPMHPKKHYLGTSILEAAPRCNGAWSLASPHKSLALHLTSRDVLSSSIFLFFPRSAISLRQETAPRPRAPLQPALTR